jgi:7,8-dihydropterin-6-yl-methyl-4-(beta-D-ribofuranosyl)aminobenzene 5'-phosphate synthase
MEIEVGTADSVTIYTLLEDYTGYGTSLYAQHGVSFLLDVTAKNEGKKVLFDVGQSAQPLLHNMEVMGLDPKTIDMIFLSHCHYDHTGGLVGVLKAMEKDSIPVVAHPEIFRVNLATDPYLRHVGLIGENTREKVEEYGGRWILVKDPMKLMEGVVTTGEVSMEERVSFEKKVTLDLYNIEGGTLVKDSLLDDISLVIKTPSGLIAVSGCSHAGVVSIVKKSMEISGSGRLRAVIGGYHLIDATEERIEETIKSLKELKVEKIYTGHCTGLKAECRFLTEFREDFEKLHCGKIMKF